MTEWEQWQEFKKTHCKAEFREKVFRLLKGEDTSDRAERIWWIAEFELYEGRKHENGSHVIEGDEDMQPIINAVVDVYLREEYLDWRFPGSARP